MTEQIVDRIIHYIAEAYDDKDTQRLSKLRHDITCGMDDVINHHKRKVLAYNETKLRVKKEFRIKDNPCMLRVLQWMEDAEAGRTIRSQNGYKEVR